MVNTLVSIYFGSPQFIQTIKTNGINFQAVDPEIFSILIFLKKGLGPVSPPHFGYDFSRQVLLMLYSTN